jgi:hypothetical protein
MIGLAEAIGLRLREIVGVRRPAAGGGCPYTSA